MSYILTIVLAAILASPLNLAVVPASARERVDLTSPDQVRPGTSTYRIKELNLNFEAKVIVIVLLGANGEVKEVVYDRTSGAVALLRGLNKANLSVKSLHRRIMEQLISDNHLGGTISGIPD